MKVKMTKSKTNLMLPWRCNNAVIETDTSVPLLIAKTWEGAIAQAKPNAQYIVKAVNNHEKLVEMLDGVLWKLTSNEGLDDFMIKEAQQLLKEIEGGEDEQ